MKRLLYFAYGSNLSIERLTDRVGQVGVVGTHVLQGYELYFSSTGFANIRPREGASVEGVLYIMSPAQHKRLDFYEGLYIKEYFEVGDDIVSVYIESESASSSFDDGFFFRKSRGCLPTAGYLNFIIEGAIAFGLERTAIEVDNFKKKNLKLKSYRQFNYNS